MIGIDEARERVLLLPEVTEKKHFERPDFRVRKKIFAVLHQDKNAMVIKLSVIDQNVFCSFDKEVMYPVPGGWGKQGWTFLNLKKIKKSMFTDALFTSWKTVAGIKLTQKHFGSHDGSNGST